MNLDIDGYLTSPQFVAQIAAIIATILSTVFGQLLSGLFGQT